MSTMPASRFDDLMRKLREIEAHGVNHRDWTIRLEGVTQNLYDITEEAIARQNDDFRTLLLYSAEVGQELRYGYDANGDRYHFRAPEATALNVSQWECVKFDNTNLVVTYDVNCNITALGATDATLPIIYTGGRLYPPPALPASGHANYFGYDHLPGLIPGEEDEVPPIQYSGALFYKFDETDPVSPTAEDSSGNGRHATVQFPAPDIGAANGWSGTPYVSDTFREPAFGHAGIVDGGGSVFGWGLPTPPQNSNYYYDARGIRYVENPSANWFPDDKFTMCGWFRPAPAELQDPNSVTPWQYRINVGSISQRDPNEAYNSPASNQQFHCNVYFDWQGDSETGFFRLVVEGLGTYDAGNDQYYITAAYINLPDLPEGFDATDFGGHLFVAVSLELGTSLDDTMVTIHMNETKFTTAFDPGATNRAPFGVQAGRPLAVFPATDGTYPAFDTPQMGELWYTGRHYTDHWLMYERVLTDEEIDRIRALETVA